MIINFFFIFRRKIVRLILLIPFEDITCTFLFFFTILYRDFIWQSVKDIKIVSIYIYFSWFEIFLNIFPTYFHYYFFFQKIEERKSGQKVDQSKMIIGNVNISIENNSCYWRYSFENSIYRHGYSLMPAQCSVDLMKRWICTTPVKLVFHQSNKSTARRGGKRREREREREKKRKEGRVINWLIPMLNAISFEIEKRKKGKKEN